MTSGGDRRTVGRDAVTMRPVRRFRGGGLPHTLSPDGLTLAVGGEDGSVRLLDLQTGKVRATAGRHDGAVTDLRFTPDSRMLVTAGGDGRVNVWSVTDATRIDTFAGHAGAVLGPRHLAGRSNGLQRGPGRQRGEVGPDRRATPRPVVHDTADRGPGGATGQASPWR